MDAIATVNRTIDQVTIEFNGCKQIAAVNIVRMGQLLIEAKAMLPHGQWGSWLKEKVEFSERSAQNFMRVAREYAANPQLVADLGSIRKAVALLDVPSEEREAFAQEHDAATCTARELEEAIRDNAKLKEDLAIKDVALQTANSCLEGRNEELAQARRELAELKSRPVDVAIETVVDEAAIKKAAKEAASEAKAKAEAKAAKELERRQSRILDLERQLEKAAESNDTERADRAEALLAQTRRELAIAKNEDLLQAQICFNQIKDNANRLHGYILLFKGRNEMREMESCRRSARALAQFLNQVAEEGE